MYEIFTSPNSTLSIICQCYIIPVKLVSLAPNVTFTNILGFVFVILFKVFESLMKLSQVLVILFMVIREEVFPNKYTLLLLFNCITQRPQAEYKD